MTILPRHRPLFILLIVYLAVQVAWTLSVPLGEAPDEPGHYNYARILAAEQRLPDGAEEHEAFQPPLYYVLAAPFVGLGDARYLPLKGNADFTLEPGGPANLLLHTSEESLPWAGWVWSWRLARLVSTLSGMVTLCGLYLLGLLVSGGKAPVAIMAATVFVLTPQFTLVHGAATNDSLVLALVTFLFCEVVLILKKGVTSGRMVAIGVLWGLAIMSKTSAMAAGPAIALATLLAIPKSSLSIYLQRVFRYAVLLAMPLLLLAGWWFLRNQLIYGDPLAWKLIYEINKVRSTPVPWPSELAGLYRSYWLYYVGMFLPGWLYVVLALPLLATVVGCLRWLRKDTTAEQRKVLAVAAVYSAAFLLSWARWAMAVEGTGQARLLYPAVIGLVPLAALYFLSSFPVRKQWCITGVVLVAMMAINLYGLISGVRPVFSPAPRTALADVPGVGVAADFGGDIRLIAYSFDQSAPVGGSVHVDTWWEALRPLREDIWLTLRLVTPGGEVPVWKRGSPTAGRDTTDRWPVNVALFGGHRLLLPADMKPGTYILEAGLQPFGSDSWLPAGSGSGDMQEFWPLGEVTIKDERGQ